MRRGTGCALAVLAAAVVAAQAGSSAGPISGWLSYGNGPARESVASNPARSSPLRIRWNAKLRGRVTSQALVVRGIPGPGQSTVYAATSAGVVYALNGSGRVRWQVQLGHLTSECQQLDGYGITGTPVVDRATRALYVADALGRLHALDLVTGAERAGWPVRLYADPDKELVWGALTILHGAVYAGTGSYCDVPMEGKVIRVDIATREVSRWVVVPASSGGGGGIWGWGGIAYDAGRDSLLAVTGNAFRGGSNDGPNFREWAPYGEHLVELSPDLRLRAASHPADLNTEEDLDFVGSPVVAARPGCGPMAVALNKNGRLYAWRVSRIDAGVAWSMRVAPFNERIPLISQPAYSSRLRSIFVVTSWRIWRIGLTSSCGKKVVWSRPLRPSTNSPPTVAGATVWFVHLRKKAKLLGVDARTGSVRTSRTLGKDRYFVAPTVAGGRIYTGSFEGLVTSLG